MVKQEGHGPGEGGRCGLSATNEKVHHRHVHMPFKELSGALVLSQLPYSLEHVVRYVLPLACHQALLQRAGDWAEYPAWGRRWGRSSRTGNYWKDSPAVMGGSSITDWSPGKPGLCSSHLVPLQLLLYKVVPVPYEPLKLPDTWAGKKLGQEVRISCWLEACSSIPGPRDVGSTSSP
jgi:hypothetical protein